MAVSSPRAPLAVITRPSSIHGHDQRAADSVHREALLLRHADLCTGNLTGAAFAPQLLDHSNHHETRRIPAVAVRKYATVRVHRQGPSESGMAFLDKGSSPSPQKPISSRLRNPATVTQSSPRHRHHYD